METEEQSEGLAFHPMDQFKIQPLFNDGPIHWYTITNATLWMAVVLLCVLALFVIGTRGRAIIPSRMQSVAELGYGLLWFTGRASTAVLVTVIIGIAIVFSADAIVGAIAG